MTNLGVAPDMSLSRALTQVAHVVPDRVAVVDSGRRITYGALDAEVSKLAQGLRGRLSSGSPVVLLLPTGWQAIRGFFAVTRAGAVAVPLNPGLKLRQLEPMYRDVHPRAIVSVRSVPGNDVQAMLSQLRRIGVDSAEVIFAADEAPPWASRLEDIAFAADAAVDEAASGEVAAIFYTTGTTGDPKGVAHTHSGLVHSFLAMEELEARFFSGSPAEKLGRIATLLWRYRGRLLRGRGPRVWMTPLPWYSIAGFRVILQALLGGHTLVLMDRFQPRQVLELVERERVSVLAAAPSMAEAVLRIRDLDRYNLSSLLVLGLGASPTAPELVRQARARLGCAVVVGYGATETGGGVLVTRMDDSASHLEETVGRPFPGAEVRAVDEDRHEVPPGTIGELACRVPGLMAGYHRAPDATAAVVDQDGWYYTGDLVVIDEDGYVRVVGRKRDLIIRGGQNVVPAEIEQVLLEHADVAQAAVVGVPDRAAGEAIWAFVVPPAGAVLDPAELRSHCVDRLEPHKLVDRLRIESSLPLTETGEVSKLALRELALTELAERRQGRQDVDRTAAGRTGSPP